MGGSASAAGGAVHTGAGQHMGITMHSLSAAGPAVAAYESGSGGLHGVEGPALFSDGDSACSSSCSEGEEEALGEDMEDEAAGERPSSQGGDGAEGSLVSIQQLGC
jgi:hypothetical protein